MARPRARWRDALAAQMELWSFIRTERGREWLAAHMRANTPSFLPDKTRGLLRSLYASEETRLRQADPVFVSAEMCELIDAAQRTFQPEPLILTDLITESAFVYFDTPFQIPDRFDTPTDIAAFSYAPVISSDRPPGEATREEVEAALERWRRGEAESENERGDFVSGIAVTLYATSERYGSEWDSVVPGLRRPALLQMHLTPWWFGMTFDGNEVDLDGKPTGAAYWWRIVQATLRIMNQRIAVRHEERPERAERREMARLRFPERGVISVRLRRERTEGHEPSGEPANYSHRFIVGGHWRDQWFPSAQAHRQIWISPYVKGPQDKPLIVKPRRVFTLER